MLINLKVKTLDSQTHEFSIDNEITVREFKDKVAEKTNIAADQQRIIYCGRVMVDDKQLKEYDVDGKVVHVAERPPPSQRLPSSDNAGSNSGNPVTERRARGRTGAGGMRNSPLFRALDGMVVGTMAFPVNASANGQTPVNPLAASSSFCMNRITVARHMLDCANNIAAFLEDPSRGLNNQSLDILARGRWTMESTVVEVGITSDIPQSQQIVEMVQGAVQAALRRSGNANVTLVQLPTVYSSNEGEGGSATPAAAAGGATAGEATTADNNATADVGASADNETETETDTDAEADIELENASTTAVDNANSAAASSVAIEDVIIEDEDDDTPTNEQSTDNNSGNTTAAAVDMEADNASGSTSANEEGNTDQSRRRTGTRVLARVIEQMRNVQNRLNPFVEQYYEMLQNEPNFEEDDTAGRENAQRLFDRVSEAFHYLSHAQHAISDLMLDVSQASPRFLTCRPILVEQSGYVSSNFITPAVIPAVAMAQQQQPSRGPSANNANNSTTNPTTATATSASGTASSTVAASNDATNSTTTTTTTASTSATNTSNSNANNGNNSSAPVEDPVDDWVRWPPINFGLPPTAGGNNASNATNANTATGSGNFQRQVARLLQDVVSAAPFDTEFHVHINSPNVVSIDVPIGAAAAAAAAAGINRSAANARDNNTSSSSSSTESNTTSSTTAATATAAAATTSTSPGTTTPSTTNDSNTTSPSASAGGTPSNANPARVTTATLPTTSTQTRSTARPQVHIGNIPVLSMPPGWNGRALPASNVSSFDRFLPCNSHHIRDHESAGNDNNGNNANGNAANSGGRGNRANIITRRPLRSMLENVQGFRLPSSRLVVGSTMTDPSRSANSAAMPLLLTAREEFGNSLRIPELRRRLATVGAGGAAASGAGSTSSTAATTDTARSTSADAAAELSSSTRPWPFDFTSASEEFANWMPTEPRRRSVAASTATADASRSTNNNAANAATSTTGNNNTTLMFDMATTTAETGGESGSGTTTTLNNRQINMHSQLMNFVTKHVFEGKPINDDTMPPAINRAIQWFGKSLIFLPQYEKPEYDSRDSLLNILRNTLPHFIRLMRRSPLNLIEFEQNLKEICKQFRTRMYSVLYVCIGRDNVAIYWSQLMRLLSVYIRSNMGDEVVDFLTIYLNPTLPSCTDEDDAQQFIVYRNSSKTQNNNTDGVTPMDTDVEMTDVGSSQPEVDDEPLPTIVPGSANWHRNFPNNWLPIIARDIQRQTENPPNQPPYSDAYISGMSSKRRKLIQHTKPPTEINALIADSVSKAIQNAGVGSSTSSNQTHTPDDIARIIANDMSVQTSCTEAVRLNVRERLKTETDYDPEKFPKSTKFIQK